MEPITPSTLPLLTTILETEAELRRHLDRLHRCLDRVERIHDDEIARYHGLLLTLRSGLSAVRGLEHRGF